LHHVFNICSNEALIAIDENLKNFVDRV